MVHTQATTPTLSPVLRQDLVYDKRLTVLSGYHSLQQIGLSETEQQAPTEQLGKIPSTTCLSSRRTFKVHTFREYAVEHYVNVSLGTKLQLQKKSWSFYIKEKLLYRHCKKKERKKDNERHVECRITWVEFSHAHLSWVHCKQNKCKSEVHRPLRQKISS